MIHPKQSAGLWPAAICLLIFLFLALTAWSVRQASLGVSSVTNPSYYSHGLKYNQTLVEKEAAASLGWNLETSLDGRRVLFRLKDASGGSVTGAEGRVVLFDSERQSILALLETSPGTYAAELPSGAGKGISGRLELRRNGASLSRALLLNL